MRLSRIASLIFCLLVFLSFVSLGVPSLASAEYPMIGVVYPDVRKPYNRVFLDIISGIEAQLATSVKRFAIGQDTDVQATQAWLQRERLSTVILLGNQGLKAAQVLQNNYKVVVGAALVTPGRYDQLAGISLIADPQPIFRRLKELAPQVNTVTVIYNRNRNSWLIERARQAAGQEGVRFNAISVDSLRAAATRYKEQLQKMRPDTDAIWLIQDSMSVDEKVLLPLILEQAWQKRLVVFSNAPAHVKRGALFSLFPDNVRLGHKLATIALSRLHSDSSTPLILPLQDLLAAINLRTAEHLSLGISNMAAQQFDLTFPARN